jgi:hypothetical protein
MPSSPASANSIAAVAIPVRGQSALNATPYFAIVYATCPANQRGDMSSGGDNIST